MAVYSTLVVKHDKKKQTNKQTLSQQERSCFGWEHLKKKK